MLITSGMLWKQRHGSPTQHARERVLVCILQSGKLANASGLEGFFLIRLWACEFYWVLFLFSPFPAGIPSEGI